MKLPIHRRKFFLLPVFLGLFFLPNLSYSQTFFGVSSNPADNAAKAGPTTTVTPPAAMIANDLVIIYAEYRGTGVAISIGTTGGQTWNTATTNNGSNQTFTIFWCTFNGVWAANPTVTVGAGANGLTGVMYVFRPSVSNSAWGVNVAPTNSSSAANPNTITGITTTAPNTVSMAFWGSAATNTWGTLAGAGWSKTGLSAQYRNTTTGQSHTATYNIQASAATLANVSQTQSAATTALTSIMSWYQRGNDDCSGAISLNSGASCSPTAGTLVNATNTALANTCGALTGTRKDVWYSFVAETTNPIITIGSGPANSRYQIFSGTCAVPTSVYCSSSASEASSGLTVGTTYLLRIYSNTDASGTFTICIRDQAPANDDCSGAVTLTPGTSCVNTSGTVISATLSSGVPLPICGTPVYDVWYSFVAQSSVQTVTLSSLGANFTNPGLQVLSGICGSLTTLGCSSSSALTVSGLSIGTTYYVRVYSTSAAPTSSGTFNICITNIPANDDCTGSVLLTSSTSCVNTAGTLVNANYTAVAGACGASNPDVWYTFTAQSTNPTITIGSGPANSRFQVFSGTCGSPTSVFCSAASSQAVPGLTVGNTYLVRVYSSTGASGTFNICIVDPAPANDNCAGAVTLTSSTTCTTTSGTMYGATVSAATITAPDCAGTVVYDVWYKFVAQTTNPTITLSNIGVNFTNPAMELLSNNCGGTFTAYYCGTTSIAADFLTPGTTYFIRVYSSSGSAPTSATNAGFDICIVDPVATAPFNDDCANAIYVPIWNTCNNVSGNMAGATLSSGVVLAAPCAGTVAYDVWYKFTAVTNNTATITLSSIGANFTSSGLQIFSGTCGSLTSIACSNSTSVTTPALTTGNIYYIRVFSTAGPAPNGNARFNICATTINAPVRFGNSYVNISKKTTGGVIQPGDTLEIRFTINHTSGTMTALRYVDNVPSHTSMLTTSNDSIRIITNEGLTYKRYTVAADGDAATYKASPGVGEYNIRLNVGFASGAAPGAPTVMTNAATSANGQMTSSDAPKGGGGLLFAISYRVIVTGVVGDTVTLFPGQFIYNNGSGDVTLTANPFNILISNPLNLCANSIGLNNAVENGGTFGSGTTLNRGTDLTTPIAGYTFVPDVNAYNVVGDGRYAIIKNNSPRSSPVSGARRQPNCNVGPAIGPNDPLSCNNRMFGGFWYIAGDHSGTNNSIGNAPPDVNTPSGYMLEVNADYPASEVYRQTINNLCPNTYYEFSAWVKNICPNCGIDSLGHQFAASTIPADQGGYPGVLPNLTFALNNLDYYNTGEIDTLGWLKKGFVFKTATGQTTATFSIRNNAQGGGGNDWTLDDIAIATCLPTMQYSPSINPIVCRGNSLNIFDTVRSFFNNYTNYKWERSTDLGNTWTDITTAVDTTLTLIGSTYQFITKYTIPPSHTKLANSNDLYRVVVATSSANLVNSACLYTDASTIITLSVIDCGTPLSVDLLSFTGKNNNGNADLQWVTSRENEPVTFNLEKSNDGSAFNSIATVKGHGNNNENNFYQYTDPAAISGQVWYRLALVNKDGKKKYSRIVSLSDQTIDFGFTNVINPFNHELDFAVSVPENARIETLLLNLSGKPVRKENFNVYEGENSLIISNTDNLPAGMYILQVRDNDKVISKKLIKK